MSDKLKPCPFCGGKAKVWKSGSYGVVCNTCDANTGFIYPNEQEPVEACSKFKPSQKEFKRWYYREFDLVGNDAVSAEAGWNAGRDCLIKELVEWIKTHATITYQDGKGNITGYAGYDILSKLNALGGEK